MHIAYFIFLAFPQQLLYRLLLMCTTVYSSTPHLLTHCTVCTPIRTKQRINELMVEQGNELFKIIPFMSCFDDIFLKFRLLLITMITFFSEILLNKSPAYISYHFVVVDATSYFLSFFSSILSLILIGIACSLMIMICW